jgi:hypothetical protein
MKSCAIFSGLERVKTGTGCIEIRTQANGTCYACAKNGAPLRRAPFALVERVTADERSVPLGRRVAVLIVCRSGLEH